MFSEEERSSIAGRLVALADKLPQLGIEIRTSGFEAWKPIEAFELSFCSDEEAELRKKILLEEAKEMLGSSAPRWFSTEDGQGSTVYRSPLLESMRYERDIRLNLPVGSPRPRGEFNLKHGYCFFKPRNRKDFSLRPGQDGTAKLKRAWSDAYAVMDREGGLLFPDIPDTRWEGIGFGFKVEPKLLAQHMKAVGFDLPYKLRAYRFLVARTLIGPYWLLFCVDTKHPMQPYLILAKPYGDKKLLIENRMHIFFPLWVMMSVVGGSVPYSHPKTPRQLATSFAYYAVVMKWFAQEIRGLLG